MLFLGRPIHDDQYHPLLLVVDYVDALLPLNELVEKIKMFLDGSESSCGAFTRKYMVMKLPAYLGDDAITTEINGKL